MTPVGERDRWVRSPAVLWRTAPGFLVVADVDGELTRAEGPAAAIWDLLDEPRTIEQIAGRLAGDFDAPIAEVRDDVSRFVEELAGRGLVVPGLPRDPGRDA